MRILIVSAYFEPEVAGNAPYVTGVATELASRGHDVDVLTGVPHYPNWRRHPIDTFRGLEVAGGTMRVHRRPHYVPRHPSPFRRGVYEVSLLLSGALRSRRLERPHVVLAFSPALSDAVLGLALARRFRVPLTIVFQDLFGVAAREMEGGVPGVGATLLRVERALARSATTVGVVAEAFSRHLDPHDSLAICRLHNWPQLIAPNESREATRIRRGWTRGRVVALHGGNIGEKQGLEVVVRAAQIEPSIQFVFAGAGNREADLRRLTRQLRLENVAFLGSQFDQDYANLLNAADVLLLVQQGSVGDMSLPSKLHSYLASGVPIVASVAAESEAAEVVLGCGRGVLAAAGSPAALVRGIRSFDALPRAGFDANSQHARFKAVSGYEALLQSAVLHTTYARGRVQVAD